MLYENFQKNIDNKLAMYLWYLTYTDLHQLDTTTQINNKTTKLQSDLNNQVVIEMD